MKHSSLLEMFDREKKSVCQSITALHTLQEKNAYETLFIFSISQLPPTTILLTFRALSFRLLPSMKSALRKWLHFQICLLFVFLLFQYGC